MSWRKKMPDARLVLQGPAICMVAYTTYETDARVMRQAETAATNGYRVDFITPRRAAEKARETIRGVNLHRIPPKPYKGPHRINYVISYAVFMAFCFVKLSGLHLRHRYKVIHVNNMPDLLVLSALFAKVLGAKIILDIHDPMPETYRAKFSEPRRGLFFRFLLAQEKFSAACADSVLTVNEPVKMDILVKDGIPRDKITVVANFPDGRIFSMNDPQRIEDLVRMIYYGSISERFGLLDVLEAIAQAKNKERLRLRIIGEGDLTNSLKKKILDLTLESIIDFDDKPRPLIQLPQIIANHHLGLVPYRPSPATQYMLPVKLLELTAMGIPAITVANVPIRYYFSEGAYFAYDNARIASLTALIERILDRPSLILERRREILKLRDKFLWRNESFKYLAVIRALSEGGPR